MAASNSQGIPGQTSISAQQFKSLMATMSKINSTFDRLERDVYKPSEDMFSDDAASEIYAENQKDRNDPGTAQGSRNPKRKLFQNGDHSLQFRI